MVVNQGKELKNRSGILAAGTLALVAVIGCTTAARSADRAIVDGSEAGAGSNAPEKIVEAGYGAPYVDNSSFATSYRRLTESQYRNTIADLFGPEIKINARFEPERREDGLQAIGNARLSITTTGLEQYFSIARSIADQVMESESRDALVGCVPRGTERDDRVCAERFIKGRGQRLFRRPLSQAEIDGRIKVWQAGADQSRDFYKGLKLSLVSLLMAPEFLFRIEKAEEDPASPGMYRLDAYTKATRIAFLLWDSAPDSELLEAARSGAIHTPKGLAAQVNRMTASARVEDGVRALFTDMLQFERYETLTKDPATYPKFSQRIADSSREETLRFLVDHLVTKGLDYRDIFTSRATFLNRSLAAVYDVPYPSAEPWTRYEFAEDTERSGVLTQASFLSLFSHPASSSPTVRGVKLHEIFMCLHLPDPPADVDFSKVQAVRNGTVRTRLIDHMTNPGCNTCHAISDPAGLTLEHFDGLGQKRLFENGVPIDVNAVIGGKSFSGARGLGAYLHDSPLVPACIVRNVHYYGVGRPFDSKDAGYLAAKGKAFADGGFRLTDLFRTILTDPEFYKVVVPERVPMTAADQGVIPTASGGGQ